MYIEHKHCDGDGERDQDHGEEEVLPQQGDSQRGGRDDLSQQQEEHSEGEQDRNTKRHFLSGVWR